MEKVPKILIIDDDREVQFLLGCFFKERAIVLKAYTVQEGEQVFDANPDVSLIALDGCMPEKEGDHDFSRQVPATIGLARKIRRTYKGPLVAMSVNHNAILMAEGGCNYGCQAYDLPSFAIRLLCFQPKI